MSDKVQRPMDFRATTISGTQFTAYERTEADAFIEYLETELLYTRRALSIAAATSSTEWLPRDYIASGPPRTYRGDQEQAGGMSTADNEQLWRRIAALELALYDAAREKFPDGTVTDAVLRGKAIERWKHNAYLKRNREAKDE